MRGPKGIGVVMSLCCNLQLELPPVLSKREASSGNADAHDRDAAHHQERRVARAGKAVPGLEGSVVPEPGFEGSSGLVLPAFSHCATSVMSPVTAAEKS